MWPSMNISFCVGFGSGAAVSAAHSAELIAVVVDLATKVVALIA